MGADGCCHASKISWVGARAACRQGPQRRLLREALWTRLVAASPLTGLAQIPLRIICFIWPRCARMGVARTPASLGACRFSCSVLRLGFAVGALRKAAPACKRTMKEEPHLEFGGAEFGELLGTACSREKFRRLAQVASRLRCTGLPLARSCR